MNGATFPTTGVAALPTTAPNANAVFNNVALVNSQRISIVSERLAMCAQSNNPNGATYFFNLCISLSRGIDFAIANNEIPAQVSNLPKVCKLVCQRRKDCNLQAAIMVLMVTMKHACTAQWFSTEETQELLALAEEVAKIFNTHEGVSTEQTNINPTVSQIMSRYYPRIKLGHILASVDIKPGFEACAVDFHISKNMSSRTEKRIQLLVAMKDNIETSSCIITPQKVNFMLNGKGVLGRTVGHTELGPQLPTVVTNMLRYGTNLLQAIGHFDAHYIVLIAFMGDVPSSFLPVPDDYAQPATVTVESDAEVVEGSSRISLNCPITFKRIKRPAKGKLCKHFQCFDLSNFLEMNSRCPSWRCPHCNQSICYPDLRIDKKMSKILQEVAESVVTVIINSDGSWEGIAGNDDHKDEPIAKPTEAFQEESDQPAASGLPNEPCNVYDLTEGDDNMVVIDVDMPEDTKPIIQSDLLNTSTYMSHFAPSAAGNPIEINQNSATQVQGISPSGPLETLSGLADYSTRTNTQLAGGASAPMLGHLTAPPVLTDSVSLAARQTQRAFMGNNQQSSLLPSVPSATNAMQLQQTPRQQMASSVYGGHPIPRNVSREPTANQGLPAQMPSPLISTRPTMNNLSGNTSAMNSVSRNTPSLPSRTSVHSNVPINASATHRDSVQQQHSTAQMRGLTSSAQVPNNTFRPTSIPQAVSQPRSSTALQVSNNTFRPTASPQPTNQPRSTTPVQVHSNAFRPISSPQLANQPRSTTPVQVPNNTFRPTSSPQPTNQTRPTNHMLPHTLSTPPHLRARTQTQPGGPMSGNNRTINPQYLPVTPASLPSAQQAAAVPRSRQLPTTPIQMPTSRANPASVPSSALPGRTVQTVSRTQDLVDAQPEQNWQPSGRMRGSLTGRAFSESLSPFVIRPTQQTTPPNQVSNTASTIQALLNRNLHASSQPNPSQNNNS